ncbi:MAG: hypothetical protein RR490_10435, partial [Niameybacter sp.]
PIVIVIILFSFCSCSKTDVIMKTVNQPTDTIRYTTLYAEELTPTLTHQSLPTGINNSFNVQSISVSKNELFCANINAQRVDVFEANTLQYKESFAESMICRDVFADEQYIFVTGLSNPRCQVSVYDRQSKEYICRLGNGSYSGPLTHPISVIANDKYIFVRDQSTVIKVFLRKEIASGKNLNVYCRLNIEKSQAMNTENYDFGIFKYMLYAVNNKNSTIYMYDLSKGLERNIEHPFAAKFKYADSQQPFAFSASDKYLFIGTKIGNKAQLNVYKQDMDNLADLGNTFATISTIKTEPINHILSLGAKGDTLLIATGKQSIIPLRIKERYYNIVTPKP